MVAVHFRLTEQRFKNTFWMCRQHVRRARVRLFISPNANFAFVSCSHRNRYGSGLMCTRCNYTEPALWIEMQLRQLCAMSTGDPAKNASSVADWMTAGIHSNNLIIYTELPGWKVPFILWINWIQLTHKTTDNSNLANANTCIRIPIIHLYLVHYCLLFAPTPTTKPCIQRER